jgi:radical SAM superfamily enzyme YgiQ (UPF0313 family)
VKPVLLVSCYELGHQPLGLAWPLALFRQAGFDVAALDLAVQPFDDRLARAAHLVAIAAPMHTALRLGVAAADRVRAINPGAHICFWGLYAGLNADYLLATAADSVVAGENESALVALAQALDRREPPEAVPGVAVRGHPAAPALLRPALPVPDRRGLPSLTRYARYVHDGTARLAGYVEASRGCLHTCRHCPIVPIYGGRFFAVPVDTVLADLRQQVGAGAEHITFGDPDFLNGPGHALRLARGLQAEFPGLTFDFTTKVEHILQHRGLFAEFAALGATFVTSAIESLSPLVLARLDKGHTAADIDEALDILDAAGIALRPTLVAFTPWTSLEHYIALLDFIRARGLQSHVPPIQLGVRLLVPPGSPLLGAPDAAEWLGELDPAAFGYRWAHPDPRMDALHAQVIERLALADERGEAAAATYEAVRALAEAAAGLGEAQAEPREAGQKPSAIRSWPRPEPPRLTEDWFC